MEQYVEQVVNNFSLKEGGYFPTIDGFHHLKYLVDLFTVPSMEWTNILLELRIKRLDGQALR